MSTFNSIPVCDVEDIMKASNEELECLRKQFGRNGPMSDSAKSRLAKINEVLEDREQQGVTIESNGFVSHPV